MRSTYLKVNSLDFARYVMTCVLTFMWLTQIIMKFDTSYHTHVLQTNIYWEASLLNQAEAITFWTFPK